jgi:hypothetical protein
MPDYQLTESQRISIVKILENVTMLDISEQDAWLGSTYLTTAVKAAIDAEITRWNTAGSKFTSIKPLSENKGASIDPEREKDDIRGNIAKLLQRPDWAGSGLTVQLYRG